MRRNDAVSSAEEERYVALMAEVGPELLQYFQRRLPQQAADLLSELMVTTWRRHRRIPVEHEQARMWLFGVARNVLHNQRRSTARQVRVLGALRDLQTPADEDSTEHAAVRDMVARLPPALAEVVTLVHWEGLSLAEVAQLLHIPASTVRGRYQRARHLLREQFDAVVSLR